MIILITGANGMLAKAIRERFKDHKLILTDVDELDITDLEEVKKSVEDFKPEIIINCAAYTAVDKAEEEEELARKINCIGPRNLAIAAQINSCKIVHISTDYVFNGNLPLDEVHKEYGKYEPETVYGKTKLEGEVEVRQNCPEYYIFRTAWLYGDGNNFVRTMLKLGDEKEEVKVVFDQHGSPTYTVDLADIIYQAVIEKRISYGTYNATNLGFTTWYDFTKKIFEFANISCKVLPVTSEEFPKPAKRPKNSMLSKECLLEAEIEIPSWEDALKRYLEKELESK